MTSESGSIASASTGTTEALDRLTAAEIDELLAELNEKEQGEKNDKSNDQEANEAASLVDHWLSSVDTEVEDFELTQRMTSEREETEMNEKKQTIENTEETERKIEETVQDIPGREEHAEEPLEKKDETEEISEELNENHDNPNPKASINSENVQSETKTNDQNTHMVSSLGINTRTPFMFKNPLTALTSKETNKGQESSEVSHDEESLLNFDKETQESRAGTPESETSTMSNLTPKVLLDTPIVSVNDELEISQPNLEIEIQEPMKSEPDEIAIQSPDAIQVKDMKELKIPDYPDFDTSLANTEDSIYTIDDYDTSFQLPEGEDFLVNPVQEELKLDPVVKELILDPVSRKSTNATFDLSDLDLIQSQVSDLSYIPKNEVSNEWLKEDKEKLFSGKQYYESKEHTLEISAATEETEIIKLLNESHNIYLTSTILEPVKLLSLYSNSLLFQEIHTRNLYIDFSFHNVLSLKLFNDIILHLSSLKSSDYFRKSLKSLEFKIETTTEENARYVMDKIKSLGPLYDKIRVLGLFKLLENEDPYSCTPFSSAKQSLYKLPLNLERLVLANGFDLDDSFILNGSLKSASFYHCKKINLSKFNLAKKLEKLHIFVGKNEQINITNNARTEHFPAGLPDLKHVRLSSQVLLNSNLERCSKLQSLKLSDLNFATTRVLKLPPSLKELSLENCLISSHIASFPSTLKKLVVRGGKWKQQRILSFSRVKELELDNVELSDLVRKVNCPRGLSSLTIRNCNVKTLEEFQFPPGLKHLDFSQNSIEKVCEFPSELITVNLQNNLIKEWSQICTKVVKLNLNNNLLERIELGESVEEISVSENYKLKSISIPESTKILDISSTGIDPNTLEMSGVEKLNASNCSVSQLNLSIPKSLVELNLSGCDMESVRFDFAPNSKLSKLILSNNQIKILEAKFANVDLEVMDLSHNHLTTLEHVSLPPKINYLNLSHNNLETFDLEPTSLRSLNLSKNKIRQLASLQFPPTLAILTLDGNSLADIEDFAIPNSIKNISFEKCNIHEFRAHITPNLVSINLRHNKLHSKAFELLKPQETLAINSSVRLLDLTGNYFKDFNFDSVSSFENAYIKLSSNMFDDIPESIPSTVVCAVFNETPGSVIKNFE